MPELGPYSQHLSYVVHEAFKRPFYRDFWGMDERKVVDLVRSGALSELPIMRKKHLRDQWNEIIDSTDAVDIVSSSGTTGRPVDIPIHRVEEQNRVHVVKRSLYDLGVRPGSRVLLMFNLNDLFSAGTGAWLAVKAMGAIPLRSSVLRVQRMLQLVDAWQPEFIAGNPQALMRLAEDSKAIWPDPAKLPKRAFYAAAPTFRPDGGPTQLALSMAERWGLEEQMNQLGCSELGPIAVECLSHKGAHVHDDFHYPEVLDPDTGKPVPENTPGELVISALTFPRGFLPVRYSTGDIVSGITHERCVCGRWSPRIGPILGRIDDQLKIDGQSMLPNLLLELADACPLVQRAAVRATKDMIGDVVEILVVPNAGVTPAEVVAQVEAKLRQNIATSPKVVATSLDVLRGLEANAPSQNGVKVARFFDLRR